MPKDEGEVRDEQAATTGRISTGARRAAETSPITSPQQDEPQAAPPEEEDTSAPGGISGVAYRDLSAAMQRAFIRGGWPTLMGAACIAFLAILCVGVVLVIALKLQYPDFGAGSSPLRVLTTIVMAGLVSLGADVRLGGLELSAIPMGALLASGFAIAWATAAAVRRRDATTRARRAAEGAKVALPLAVLCGIAALAFRFGSAGDDVHVEPLSAALMGALWGALFGAWGGLRAGETRHDLWTVASQTIRERGEAWYAAAAGAVGMTVTAMVLATGAALVWVIVALASGAPEGHFGAGEAGAAMLYILAFGPNIVIALIAFSLGAPIEVGARATISGEVLGDLRQFTLFDWPGGLPWYAYFVLAIPVLACLSGGFSARRAVRDDATVVRAIPVAAAGFAAALLILAFAAEARLGGGLITARGLGRVAPNPWLTGLLALVWGLFVGYAGWQLADPQKDRA